MTTQTATTPALATRSLDDSTPDTMLSAGVDAEQFAALAKGDYQQRLLDGAARWSGSDLTGAARTYSARYASTRKALLARIEAADYTLGWAKTTTGRLVLVVGRKSTPAISCLCTEPPVENGRCVNCDGIRAA